jgi:hypothetical protein
MAGIPKLPTRHWGKNAAGKFVAWQPLPSRDSDIDDDTKLGNTDMLLGGSGSTRMSEKWFQSDPVLKSCSTKCA